MAVCLAVAATATILVTVRHVTGANPPLSKITTKVQRVKDSGEVVATVGDENITLKQVAFLYLPAEFVYEVQKQNAPAALQRYLVEPTLEKSLDSAIDNTLLYQYALKAGCKADQKYLDSFIASQKPFFHSLMPGKSTTAVTPEDKALFQEFSKMEQDLVNESGLSEDEYFTQKYVPDLQQSAWRRPRKPSRQRKQHWCRSCVPTAQ